MKLLFDQNVSRHLVTLLDDIFPDSKHVLELGFHTEVDKTIWEYAIRNGFTIVTQDSDFYRLSLIFGFRPKVIWLRYGNTSTNFIESVLRENYKIITEFINSRENAFLELY